MTEGQKQFEGQIAEKSVIEVPKVEEKMEVNWGAPEELVEETLELDWGSDDDNEEEISMEVSEPITSLATVDQPDVDMTKPKESTTVNFLTHHIHRSLALLTFSYKKGSGSDLNELTSKVRSYVSEIDESSLKQWLFFLRYHMIRQGPYKTALALALHDSVEVKMPLVKLFERSELFFTNDLDSVANINDKLTSCFAQVESLSSLDTQKSTTLSRQIAKLIFTSDEILSRLLNKEKREIETADDNQFWVGCSESKFISECIAVNITGFLLLGILNPSEVEGVQTLTRLLVTDFNKREFCAKVFGTRSQPPATSFLSALSASIKSRHHFLEKHCGENCSLAADFDFCSTQSEECEKSSYCYRLVELSAMVVINQRLNDLAKIAESQLVKRVDDLLRKWCCIELDELQELNFPSFLCKQFGCPNDKELETLNPFDGDTMISAQLSRLWKLLSKLQLVKPIFQQFYLDQIIDGRAAEYDMVSDDSISLQALGKEVLSGEEIVSALAVSNQLPKATTLSLLLPLNDTDPESSASFTDSRQIAISTQREIIEYYPINGEKLDQPIKIRMRRQVKDIRRLRACPSDPMIYAAGATTGAVHVIEFARDHHVTLLSPRDAGSRVTCLAFSANGSRLAAVEELGTIRIWILDQIINSHGFQPSPPVSKFNIGRDIYAISFLKGCGSLITGGVTRLDKTRTLARWDLLKRNDYLKVQN